PGAMPLRSNLTAPITGIIGRAPELKELRGTLEPSRLVTVTGTGGAGKTRLALEAAREWFANTDDDVWFVELAEVHESDALIPAIAAALQLSEEANRASIARITQFLGRSPAVLVLDNCEHLIGRAATLVRDLLGTCPSLRILTTSREPFTLTGEVVFALGALRLDDAVTLFAQRALAVDPQWDSGGTFSPEDTEVVEQLCLELDGLPLAIELAA